MSGNRVELRFNDGRIACWFYGVPLAIFVPQDFDPKIITDDERMIKKITKLCGQWTCTELRYSTPYTKQMNQWANPKCRVEISDYLLRKLMTPIERAK
jgi:hypothetical protein